MPSVLAPGSSLLGSNPRASNTANAASRLLDPGGGSSSGFAPAHNKPVSFRESLNHASRDKRDAEPSAEAERSKPADKPEAADKSQKPAKAGKTKRKQGSGRASGADAKEHQDDDEGGEKVTDSKVETDAPVESIEAKDSASKDAEPDADPATDAESIQPDNAQTLAAAAAAPANPAPAAAASDASKSESDGTTGSTTVVAEAKGARNGTPTNVKAAATADATQAKAVADPAGKTDDTAATDSTDPASAADSSTDDPTAKGSGLGAKLAIKPAGHHADRNLANSGDEADIQIATDAQSATAAAVPPALPALDLVAQLSEKIDGRSARSEADATDDVGAAENRAGAAAINTPETRFADRLKAAAPAEPPTEARFVEENHDKIVGAMKSELLPNGGTMKLRLDPPELGSMQVSLHMKDGIVTASFQTSNDDATRLVSHTLGDLRTMLESQGITVDKLHVQQTPKEEGGGTSQENGTGRQPTTFEQQQESRREQQRKEMVQRLWDKLAGKAPIDLVA